MSLELVWASKAGASWPPTPLMAWQATHPLIDKNLHSPRRVYDRHDQARAVTGNGFATFYMIGEGWEDNAKKGHTESVYEQSFQVKHRVDLPTRFELGLVE